MNAGHQKSLSKHFFVLLSFSAAPEAACQQTYGEKEENGVEEVHNRQFWFFVNFDYKGRLKTWRLCSPSVITHCSQLKAPHMAVTKVNNNLRRRFH